MAEALHSLWRYAAVDVGSNAVRLLLCNVTEDSGVIHFKKSEFIRVPLRLGEDVFRTGRISVRKTNQLVKTMHAFKLLIEVFDPISYRACATASLREAINREDVLDQIKTKCGLRLQVITGKQEAELIFSNHIEEMLDKKLAYLYIDVGGGSTELTLFHKGNVIASQSFNIGTLRLLHGKVPDERWEMMKEWVQKYVQGHHPVTAIGSGGNINKIFKILEKEDKPVTFTTLKEFYNEIKKHSVEDRMEIWGLNPDRADVIAPAAKIYLTVMKAAQITDIIVPQIGLADGIIHRLHEIAEHSRVA